MFENDDDAVQHALKVFWREFDRMPPEGQEACYRADERLREQHRLAKERER